MKLPVYLDYNATTPCDPAVAERMLPYFTDYFGNASSRDHSYGWIARDAVDEARRQVAKLVGARPAEIVFTSGATEAVNLALKGIAEAYRGAGNHIITQKTEHKAVLDSCAYLEENGCSVTYLDAEADGSLSLEALEQAITTGTCCIALMYANNETGVIHPVREIGALAKRHGVCFFSDATQAAGKIPVDVAGDHIDLMAFSSHKIYGPKGVGALYAASSRTAPGIRAQMHGGAQEKGLRSGTLNVPGIVGFGHAAALCSQTMDAEHERLQQLRDKIEAELTGAIPGARVNGGGRRLPHVTNLVLPGAASEELLLSLSGYLAASRGSACASNVQKPSHVLKAMGLSDYDARHSVRLSLGRFVTEEEVDFAIGKIKSAVRALQDSPVEIPLADSVI